MNNQKAIYPLPRKLQNSLLLFSFLFSFSFAKAQTYQTEKAGMSFGVTLDLGTHTNRVGIFAAAYYLPSRQIQANATVRTYLTFNSYGPKGQRDELQLSIGSLYGYGEETEWEYPVISIASNHTLRENFVSYAYNFYLDNIGTSQRTGTIGIGINRFEFLLENDAFADPILDRFRTGSFQAAVRVDDQTRIAINSLLWTGDPSADGRRNIQDPTYPARFGCLDLSDSKYGRLSHGILSLQIQRTLPFGQTTQLDLGIDAEQVRHALQNKLIHDIIILPKSWVKIRNRHIPMLDTEGEPFLFKEGQKIRRARFYGKLSLNPGVFF